MVLSRQFQCIFSISYQPPMVLRLQFQWFCAAKSNTTDQEQAYIKKIAPAKLYKVRNTIQYVQHICSKS